MRYAWGLLFALFLLPSLVAADTCPSLSLGSTGSSVTAVQKILYAAYQGFPSPTGKFDSITQTALKQWQGEHNISATGTVGPVTGAAMKLCIATPVVVKPTSATAPLTTTRTLSRGMSGSDVTALQQFLVAQKLLSTDSATGFFGALTEAAVQKFQAQKGIASSGTPATTGYGAVGQKTRTVIVSLSGGVKIVTAGGASVGSTNGSSTKVPVIVSTQNPIPTPTPTPAPNPAPADAQLCALGTAVIGNCVLQ